jgi:hypothetical protein
LSWAMLEAIQEHCPSGSLRMQADMDRRRPEVLEMQR